MVLSKKWKLVSVLLTVTVLAEAIALYCLQRNAKETQNGSTNHKWLIAGMVLYGTVVSYLLYKMMIYEGVGMVNFLWNIFSTISGFIIGIWLFQEKVNNVQWAGVFLGVLAFALIIFGDQSKQQQMQN
jgi:drug/metabolite transporter (DMT)-like permease